MNDNAKWLDETKIVKKNKTDDNLFDLFLEKDVEERQRILRDYNLIYGGIYDAIYYENSDKVKILDRNNPFTGKALTIDWLDNRFHIPDKAKIKVRLLLHEDDGRRSPLNIFMCEPVIKQKDNNLYLEDGGFIEARVDFDKEREAQIEARRMATKERKRRKEEEAKEQRKEDFKPIIDKRKIENLVDFTQITNLDKILKCGILSADKLYKKGVEYVSNDKVRKDDYKNCICTSIEYPNGWFFLRLQKDNPNIKWVILIINALVIYERKCYFARHNAATNDIKQDIKPNQKAFEGMFATEVKGKKYDDKEYYYNRDKLMEYPYLPTSEQAEVLVEDEIPIKYIKEICFKNELDRQKYADKLTALGIRSYVDEDMFTCHRDKYKGFEVR